MASGETVGVGAHGTAPLPLEVVRRECQREASSCAAAGERCPRRQLARGRPWARARRASTGHARNSAQVMLYAPPRAGKDGQALLEDARRKRENTALLDAIHGERVGTLARLIGYLEENRVIDGVPETFEVRHAMQKYAYLAGSLGAQIEYRFDFLENGAYSAALAADLYMLDRADGGTPPFREGDGAAMEFVRLVRGKGRLTLQAMTFAMRALRAGTKRDEFVEKMAREHGQYSRRLLGWAFDSVLAVTSPGSRE